MYLLQFLSPGDRWRLCQVSHGMCSRVTQCLSRVQRIEHEAVRVLHQEHANAPLILVSPKPTSPSPSPSPCPSPKSIPLPKTPIQTRSEYWLAQANLLVSIFVVGTTFDFAKAPPTNITTEKMLERALASMEVTTSEAKGYECIVLDQLVLDRLHSVTNILYDHHLTRLEHRRAIINCARYVSARVDEVLGVQDSVFDYSTLRAHSVTLGPYLVVASGQQENEFDQEHQNDIPPPTRLGSAFQVMLWHRCLSDLVALYSSIQSLHVNYKKSVPKRSRSMPTLSAPHAATETHNHGQGEKGAYPFCCSAHSLVFTPSYRAINIRELARRTVQVLRNVSLKSFWAPEPEEDPARRNIQPVVGSKLRFCHQEPQQQDRSPPKRPFLLKGSPRRQSDSGLETIGRRNQLRQRMQIGDDSRATIEDRSRLDTLKKQELLSLCHMACGLFLADQEPETGPSLAALLRSGSPWRKGVWREGEWHKSPIADQKEDHLYSSPKHNSSQSSGQTGSGKIRAKLGGILSLTKSRRDDDDDESDEQGRWQRLCLAAIRFLAHEELSWGGNKRNVELSHLKTANRSDAWTYHS